MICGALLRSSPPLGGVPPRGSQSGSGRGARADGWRRTETSRAGGGTLPWSGSNNRPQSAREVAGDRTVAPG